MMIPQNDCAPEFEKQVHAETGFDEVYAHEAIRVQLTVNNLEKTNSKSEQKEIKLCILQSKVQVTDT